MPVRVLVATEIQTPGRLVVDWRMYGAPGCPLKPTVNRSFESVSGCKCGWAGKNMYKVNEYGGIDTV